MKPLPFVVDSDDLLPSRHYPGDAGLDLYVAQDMVIPYGQFLDVPAGCRVELPDGVWGLITGRSSTIRNRGLLVVNGVIDAGWRGPLYAAVQNLRMDAARLKRGERIAQLILFDALAPRYEPTRVDALSPSDRGEFGFGSTGR